MNISSNSSVPNDEPDEIAFLELEEDRRESHDTGGNALSDRYGDEIASEEELEMGFGRRRSQVWNQKAVSVEKAEENFLTELDVDFEPSQISMDSNRSSRIKLNSDLLDIPSIGDKRVDLGDHNESINDLVPRLNQTLPSLNELDEEAASQRSYSFLAHFDQELDLNELTKYLIPLERLKKWQSQPACTWNSLMAELSELLENGHQK